jgi:dCTP deaminase
VTIKSDKWIRRMAARGHDRAVRARPGEGVAKASASSPTAPRATATTSAAPTEFKIFTNINSTIVDPKEFDEKNFVDYKGDVCIIPPNSFALARTWSTSASRATCSPSAWASPTYARCGIIVNVTPLEPEWEGHVTLEFSNTTPLPARIYANEGVAQVIFIESDELCETSYRDRGGKYQGQKGVTLPASSSSPVFATTSVVTRRAL